MTHNICVTPIVVIPPIWRANNNCLYFFNIHISTKLTGENEAQRNPRPVHRLFISFSHNFFLISQYFLSISLTSLVYH